MSYGWSQSMIGFFHLDINIYISSIFFYITS